MSEELDLSRLDEYEQNIRKWATALLSGDYKQTFNFLAAKDAAGNQCFCAAGVLEKMFGFLSLNEEKGYFTGGSGTFSENAMDALGFNADDERVILHWNDEEKHSFKYIAERLLEYVDQASLFADGLRLSDYYNV